MKIDTLFRHFREAYLGFKRNIWMSSASVSVVAVSLFIFGVSIAISLNVHYLTKGINDGIVVTVCIKRSVAPAEEQALLQELIAMPAVTKAELIPKEQGLRELKRYLGSKDSNEVLKGLEGDKALPDLIRVTPKHPQKVEALKRAIEKQSPLVDRVEIGGSVVGDFIKLSTWTNHFLLVFAIGLAVLSAFLISNSIKLNILARREEIEIQRLVGASNWFIRWPFFIEGTFIGFIGSLIPTSLLIGIIYMFSGFRQYATFQLMELSTLFQYVGCSILALGVVIGMTGSVISVSRFLRV